MTHQVDAAGAPGESGSGGAKKQPTGRRAELWMLIFAAVIVTSALVIVELNQSRTLSWTLAYYGGGYMLALAIAHLLIRRYAPYADPLLLPIVALLNGIGLVMIYRLDLAREISAVNRGEEVPTAQASLQLVWTAVALVFFLVVLLVVRDHTVLQSYAYTLALVGVLFLAVPAVLPASLSEVNGAQIWIKVPGLFSIQPAEFAKIALIIFAAAFLVSKRTVLSTAGKKIFGLVLPRARDLGPLLVALLLALVVLVRGKDLGTALLLFGTLLAMIYVATGRVSWLIIGVLGFAGGAYVAYRLFSHVRVRVDIWLDPFGDPLGSGLPAGAVAVRPRHRRDIRHRPGCRPAGHRAVRVHRLHHGRARRGTRTGRRHRDPAVLPAADGPRHPHRAGRQGRLRHPAGRRAVVLAGPADVHRGRRRHPADPADRADHPVPVLRRIVAAGQLRDPGAAGADLGLVAAAAGTQGAAGRRSRSRWPRRTPRWCRC